MEKVVLGSRGSPLALWQVHYIQKELQRRFPKVNFPIEIIKTAGDQSPQRSPRKFGFVGIFTKALEDALADSRIDAAVHSLKDVQTEINPAFSLAAILPRENPADAFLSPHKIKFSELRFRARLGTGSPRRIGQLGALGREFEFIPMRGNVETRIKKMETEGLDGIILAYAGLRRLNLVHHISDLIPSKICLPAPGQGTLVIEIRKKDEKTSKIVKALHDSKTAVCVGAERTFLKTLEGGCQIPIGALATIDPEGQLLLEGCLCSLEERIVLRSNLKGSVSKPELLGQQLAHVLLKIGGKKILNEFHRQ